MANTSVANASGLNPTWVLEKVISQYAERENWYGKFIGEGPTNVIQKVTQLQKNPGDTIKVTLFSKLGGPGIDGDNTLEGNEEALTPYQDTLLIDQKRHAVRIAGKMTDQRSAVDLHSQAAYALGVWAQDYMSELLSIYLAGRRGTRTLTVIPTGFSSFAGNSLAAPDSGHVLWAGSAGTEAAMLASDKMTTALLDKANRQIDLLINSGTPMKFPKKDGMEVRPCKITPEQWFDLQQDPDWVAAQMYAAERGNRNPLFSGSKGTWKGMEIFVDPAGVLFTTSGSITAASCQILGCQAAAIAFGGADGATEGGGGRWAAMKEGFDYGNQTGFALKSIFGAKKLIINSKDHAVFSIQTGYTA